MGRKEKFDVRAVIWTNLTQSEWRLCECGDERFHKKRTVSVDESGLLGFQVGCTTPSVRPLTASFHYCSST
jgi:hypothetical protein